jgi:hypothetical protein
MTGAPRLLFAAFVLALTSYLIAYTAPEAASLRGFGPGIRVWHAAAAGLALMGAAVCALAGLALWLQRNGP